MLRRELRICANIFIDRYMYYKDLFMYFYQLVRIERIPKSAGELLKLFSNFLYTIIVKEFP